MTDRRPGASDSSTPERWWTTRWGGVAPNTWPSSCVPISAGEASTGSPGVWRGLACGRLQHAPCPASSSKALLLDEGSTVVGSSTVVGHGVGLDERREHRNRKRQRGAP
jgi:hypothetical protein